MSKLSDLQSRMRSLRDIAAILNAMKNLSLVEITKISRFYVVQQELFQTINPPLLIFSGSTEHRLRPHQAPDRSTSSSGRKEVFVAASTNWFRESWRLRPIKELLPG